MFYGNEAGVLSCSSGIDLCRLLLLLLLLFLSGKENRTVHGCKTHSALSGCLGEEEEEEENITGTLSFFFIVKHARRGSMLLYIYSRHS